MTTFLEGFATCALCGATSTHPILSSMLSMGASELDARPLHLRGEVLSTLAQRCPECGYCAERIDMAAPGAGEVIAGEEYRRWLEDPDFPKPASTFACKALIEEAQGRVPEAAWSWIHAAWWCDDEELPEEATTCRINALRLVEETRKSGGRLTEDPGTGVAIVADLLRRTGRMEECRRWLEENADLLAEEPLSILREYQLHLVGRGDSSRHSMEKAMDWYGQRST